MSRKQVRRYQAEAAERARRLGGVSFGDLPAEAFPLTIRMEDSSTGDVLWQEVMAGPGALRLPPLADRCSPGAMVRSRITYATGRTDVWPPDDEPSGEQQ